MDKSDKIRNAAGKVINEIVQRSLQAIFSDGSNPTTVPAAVHLGCDIALGSIMPITPYLGKRPDLKKEDIEEKGAAEVGKLINHDTVLLAALIVAHMHQGCKVSKPQFDKSDNGMGMIAEMSAQSSFGPEVISDAVDDWKKLTGKNPRDCFDGHILDAIEYVTRNSTAPFDEFLAKRINATPSNTLN